VEQMKKLPYLLKKRAENYAALKEQLAGIDEISILASDGDAIRKGSHYCLAIVLADRIADKRREIISAINGRGVGTSIYYPVPVPLTTLYSKNPGNTLDAFPNASRISYQSIALPVGPHLSIDEMKTIAQAVKAAILENRS
jgi:perosamine synthetase